MDLNEICKNRWILGSLVFGLTILSYVWGKREFASAEMASWVQAIGSIAAIAAAIWTFHLQQTKNLARDELIEEAGQLVMLQGILAEVDTSWEHFYESMKDFLYASVPPNTPVDMWFESSDRPFPVYDSVVGEIGRFRDIELRRKIISTYSLARGLMSLLRINNRFIEEGNRYHLAAFSSFPGNGAIDEARIRAQNSGGAAAPEHVDFIAHHQAYERTLKARERHGESLRRNARTLASSVDDLKITLQTEIARRAR